MKNLIKRFIPTKTLLFYHYALARFAALVHGFPAKKMIVIGVTGTKGKTSTINFIWSALSAGGYKTGIISTANIRIGDEEFMNPYHMTMPGRFKIQKLMARMAAAGCTYCLVETTSEGVKQYRHIGVYYDIGVFTNLSPEHLPSHGGSYEKYKQAKGEMFAALGTHKKVIGGKTVEKIIIANADDEAADYFLSFPADKKITFGVDHTADPSRRGEAEVDVVARDIGETGNGVTFSVGRSNFALGILGKFNVPNALPAIIVARLAGASDSAIARGLADLQIIPGRMEQIDEGQDFTVIVDYAHEKKSITHVLNTARAMSKPGAKVIISLGAEGGGRDKSKRPIMGELAGTLADYVVVCNVDPYEDDPKEILEDIATVSERFGKVRGKDLFVIEDRREGIRKSLSLAGPDDIVLITGKGAEQSIVIGGVSAPWDDRTVVREELARFSQS